MTNLKDQIAANFSNAAATYDQFAVMQQQAAHTLTQRLSTLRDEIPEGPVLEVGCGTGAVSRGLALLFPRSPLTLIDLAPGMIAKNRAALLPLLDRPDLVDWQVRDAETLAVSNHYALITSCLTLQWFQDLDGTLRRLTEALRPGGVLLCSYLGAGSFPEWRAICQALALPCTINPLPTARESLDTVRGLGLHASMDEETIRIPYPSARAFFHSLKMTGTGTLAPRPQPTGTETHAAERLTRSQLARLLNTWQGQTTGPVAVTYQINTLLVRA
jgi:malonyl-CoA O-methyltransferase